MWQAYLFKGICQWCDCMYTSASGHNVHSSKLIWGTYRWVPLKPDFLGAWKSVRLKHYLAYPVIIISLIMQRNLAIKIRAKRESGLTAVRLKRDPPVYWYICIISTCELIYIWVAFEGNIWFWHIYDHSILNKSLFLVFHRKDLCDARPKPEVCSKFQMSFLHLDQMYPPSRGIWWPRAVLHQVSLTFGKALGQGDIQSDVPPSRGIWWQRAVLHWVSLTFTV